MKLEEIRFHLMLIAGAMVFGGGMGWVMSGSIDCNHLSENGFNSWVKDNPGKTQLDYKNSCLVTINNVNEVSVKTGILGFSLFVGVIVVTWVSSSSKEEPKRDQK